MASSFTPPNFTPNFTTPEAMQSLIGEAQARAKASMEKSATLIAEFGEFAKGNLEALMTSSRAAAQGVEVLGQDVADFGKKSMESASAAFTSFAAAKTPAELFALQSDYARVAIDAAVAEGSRLSEAMLKLAGEIAQPISTRVALAAEKIKTPPV